MGFMLSYLTGYGISVLVPNDGWRYMFGIGSVFALFQFVGMIFMPESPVWLKDNGQVGKAQRAILQIGASSSISEDMHDNGLVHGGGGSSGNLFGKEVRDDLNSLNYSSLNIEQPISSEDVPVPPEGLTMSTMRKYFRQIIIAFFLSVMQNFCGHPNVLNFAPEIFAQIGFDTDEGRLIITTFVGMVSVFCF